MTIAALYPQFSDCLAALLGEVDNRALDSQPIVTITEVTPRTLLNLRAQLEQLRRAHIDPSHNQTTEGYDEVERVSRIADQVHDAQHQHDHGYRESSVQAAIDRASAMCREYRERHAAG